MNSKASKFLGFLVIVVILSSIAETRDNERKDKGSNPVEDEKSRGYCYRGCVRGLLGRCKKCCAQPPIIVADDDDQPMAHPKGSKEKEISGTGAATEEANDSGDGGGHGAVKGGSAGGHGGGKGGGGEGPGNGL